MKIYTKIVINMETNKVIHKVGYDYYGTVTLCCGGGGGTTVVYPDPSPQEVELMEMQLTQLKKMGKDTEALRPYLLSGMGLKEVDGKMIKMTDDEYYESLDELGQKGYEVAMAAAERSLKAYAGELEISPALEKNLANRKEELTEALSRNLGSGWQSSTAGIQAMAQFDETSNLIREEVRSGIISNEGAMALSSLDYMSGVGNWEASQFPTQQTGGIFGGAGQMVDYYKREREGEFQAAASNAQQAAQRQAGLMSGFGQLAGSGMMAAATYWSAKVLKKNIKTILNPIEQIKSIRGVDFDWKQNSKHAKGVVAEELETVIPEAVSVIDGFRAVEYHQIIPVLIEALKAQQVQIDQLMEKK